MIDSEEFYYELIVTPSSNREFFLNFIIEIYNDAIEEDRDSFILRSSEDLSDVRWGIEEFSKKLSEVLNSKIDVTFKTEKKKNIDWIKSYQDSIKPIEVGKFYIRPSWYEKKNNFINIVIDPSLAFGSGHHETTNSCLNLISEHINKNHKILDVGSGSGILAIASSKLDAIVDICDTDELAIDSAKNNSKLNNTTINNSWIGSASMTDDVYDVVIANIVADVLIFIAKDLKNRTKDNGLLILSGILEPYKEKVLEKFKDFKVIDVIKNGEWFSICLKKENE